MASLTSNRNLNFKFGNFLDVVATANVPFSVPDDLADEIKDVAERSYGTTVTIDSYDRGPGALAPSGVADNVALQAAIAGLPAAGGKISLAPGTYAIAAVVTLTANVPVKIEGYGAVLKLAAGVTGLTISQGISGAKGVRLEGLTIDGQSNTTTIGVLLRDTNNASLVNCEVTNCGTGIDLDSNASNKFVEGTLLDNVLLRDNIVGIDFTVVSGSGSFAQTMIRGLKCVVGASGIGLRLNSPGILQRSIIQGTFWIDSNETALSLDGNIEDSTFDVGIEGSGGATGNIGLVVGTNALNPDQAFIKLLFTGTVATQVTANNKNFHYWSGGSQIVQSTGNAVLGYKRHGDTTDRLRFEGLTAGGRIQFGTGALLDTNIYRSAANVLSSDDKIDAASVNLQTKAGTPVDGDITGGAADGDVVVDTSASKIWVRIGGTWKGVTVA